VSDRLDNFVINLTTYKASITITISIIGAANSIRTRGITEQ